MLILTDIELLNKRDKIGSRFQTLKTIFLKGAVFCVSTALNLVVDRAESKTALRSTPR